MWNRLEYNFETQVGALHIAFANCTDMDGAIQVFKAIDKNVRCIWVFAADQPDTLYKLDGGEWKARIVKGR